MPDRFILQKSETRPNIWVCTDTLNGIVCEFENKNFNDNQKFTILENITNPDSNALAKAVRELSDWLRANHYARIFLTLSVS